MAPTDLGFFSFLLISCIASCFLLMYMLYKLSAICTCVGALAAVKAHQTDANNKIAMKQAYMTAPWSSKL